MDFDYTPIGSVVSVTRGAIRNAWSYSVDTEKAFSDIGKKVKAIGADGLINMKILILTSTLFIILRLLVWLLNEKKTILKPM